MVVLQTGSMVDFHNNPFDQPVLQCIWPLWVPAAN